MSQQQALQWAFQYLSAHDYIISDHEKIADTSYSVVYKIKTTKETLYLKQTPKELFSEPKMLNFLKKLGSRNLPIVIAENASLCCFLMTSCGDISLRTLFSGTIDLLRLKQGIANYTKIQRLAEAKVDKLLQFIPDWRLSKFASLYYQLIQQEELLLNDGLKRAEIDQLIQLYSICIESCEELSEYRIPETIGHCDFHENNMLLDKSTGSINVVDWGESVITHPFFSLQGCLWNITYFNKVKQTDPAYSELQLQCVAPWLDSHEEEKLLKALNIAAQLNGAYAALGFERIYKATEHQQKTVQQEHSGSIAGCLRSFLDYNKVFK